MTRDHLDQFHALVIQYEQDDSWREEGVPTEAREVLMAMLREAYAVLEGLFSISTSRGLSVTSAKDGTISEVSIVERSLVKH